MENLDLTLGVEEYKLAGGGVLRFNPTDPNIYASFLDSQRQLEDIHKRFMKQAKAAKDGAAVLQLLQGADRELKGLLGSIFPGNDFDAALGGVNLLALCGDGKTVAENLLAALEGILSAGAKKLAGKEAAKLLQ